METESLTVTHKPTKGGQQWQKGGGSRGGGRGGGFRQSRVKLSIAACKWFFINGNYYQLLYKMLLNDVGSDVDSDADSSSSS